MKDRYPLFCSCNKKISDCLQLILQPLPPGLTHCVHNFHEDEIRCHMKSTADRIYYAQVLIFRSKIERATSVLNTICEETLGEYSLSVVIFPMLFWKSNFLGDNLSKELSKSSENYVVAPTYLYARYLLVNAYNSLGQIKQCERNKAEFRILQIRYTSNIEFSSMLNAMSNTILD